MPSCDYAERLRLARHVYRLSQTYVAGQVGITQKHLSQLERGRSPVLSLACGTVQRLARTLHVTTDYLLGMDVCDPES